LRKVVIRSVAAMVGDVCRRCIVYLLSFLPSYPSFLFFFPCFLHRCTVAADWAAQLQLDGGCCRSGVDLEMLKIWKQFGRRELGSGLISTQLRLAERHNPRFRYFSPSPNTSTSAPPTTTNTNWIAIGGYTVPYRTAMSLPTALRPLAARACCWRTLFTPTSSAAATATTKATPLQMLLQRTMATSTATAPSSSPPRSNIPIHPYDIHPTRRSIPGSFHGKGPPPPPSHPTPSYPPSPNQPPSLIPSL